ncbi:MAG: alpha/beta hydrolase, partial [Chloroflexota bacterium]
MSTKSIYRTTSGKAAMHALYDRQVACLGFTVGDQMISTRFGDTHLLVTGPQEGKPLVCFHGGNVTNPTNLGWFARLAQKYR